MTLPELMAAPVLVERFTRRFLRETMMFPFDSGEGCFGLAVADPTDIAAQRGAQIVLGGPIMVAVASFEEIGEVLSARLGREEEGSGAASAGQASGAAEESVDSLRDLASGAPVVRAVNDLLEKAIALRASDIHIEPMRNAPNVRMRVDGLLRTVPAPAHALPQALISRIKILAGLNISERRLPPDGAARLEMASQDIDIRVATMPTQHGESAVIRLLPRDRGLLDLPKLAFERRAGAAIRRRLLDGDFRPIGDRTELLSSSRGRAPGSDQGRSRPGAHAHTRAGQTEGHHQVKLVGASAGQPVENSAGVRRDRMGYRLTRNTNGLAG